MTDCMCCGKTVDAPGGHSLYRMWKNSETGEERVLGVHADCAWHLVEAMAISNMSIGLLQGDWLDWEIVPLEVAS